MHRRVRGRRRVRASAAAAQGGHFGGVSLGRQPPTAARVRARARLQLLRAARGRTHPGDALAVRRRPGRVLGDGDAAEAAVPRRLRRPHQTHAAARVRATGSAAAVAAEPEAPRHLQEVSQLAPIRAEKFGRETGRGKRGDGCRREGANQGVSAVQGFDLSQCRREQR